MSKSVIKLIVQWLLPWRDRLRRTLAIWIFDKPCSTAGVFRDEVVFIRWDAKLGDTVVLSWVWRELANQRSDLKLSVITHRAFEPLFRADYGIPAVYVAPKRHGWLSLLRVARQIRQPKYVVHLATEFKARDMFFIRQLRPAHVVGLDDALRMVDVKLGARTAGHHFSDKLAPWLEDLGVSTENRSYWLPENARASQAVASWWPEGVVVGLCPFGASKKRQLDQAFIVSLIRKLLEFDVKIVMLVAPHLRQSVLELIQQQDWQKRVYLNPGGATVYELFEQVRRSSAIVSVDTAVVHLATAFERPMLAIYDGTDPNNFARWHPNSRAAQVLMVPGAIAQTGELIDEGLIDQRLGVLLSATRSKPGI